MASGDVDGGAARHAATVDSMLDPHVTFDAVRDADGQLVDLRMSGPNDLAVERLGGTRDAVEGHTIREAFPDYDPALILDVARGILDSGEPLALEGLEVLRVANGDDVHIDARVVPSGDRLEVTWRDVTARERAQRALRDSEAQYRRIAERSSEVVLETGPDGLLSWVSPSVTAVLGWAPADLVGRRITDFLDPAQLGDLRARRAQLAAEGVVGGRTELRFRTADGGWRWMSDLGAPIIGEDGRIAGGIDALRDIEEERRARDALEESSALLRGVIDSMLDAWVLIRAVRDHAGVIIDFEYVDANEAACRSNGIAREQLVGSRVSSLFPVLLADGAIALYAHVVETGEPLVLDEYRFVNLRTGESGYYDNRGVRIGEYVSLSWRDVTERRAATEQLRFLATHDSLTNLVNRRELVRRVEAILGIDDHTDPQAGVLFIDLDRLKQINDEHGHAVGDEVIRAVALRIKSRVRREDVVSRFGGDEFVVILPGVDGLDGARRVADGIQAAVSEPLEIDGRSVPVTLSIGLTVFAQADDIDAALRRADTALYHAKRAGRARTVAIDHDGIDRLA